MKLIHTFILTLFFTLLPKAFGLGLQMYSLQEDFDRDTPGTLDRLVAQSVCPCKVSVPCTALLQSVCPLASDCKVSVPSPLHLSKKPVLRKLESCRAVDAMRSGAKAERVQR